MATLIRTMVFALALQPALSACTPFLDALVGDRVEVDTDDSTPPTAKVFVGSAYLHSGAGPLEVTVTDREASVQNATVVYGVGDDSEGVQFVELLDITVEPSCYLFVAGIRRDMDAPTVTVSGARIEVPLTSRFATTRMITAKTLLMQADWCPSSHPHISKAVARVRARAGNFGGGVTETATAILTMRYYPQSSPRLGPIPPRGCSGERGCISEDGQMCVPC